jgi:3-oxoacyl-[acyl-carrier-protein] synthase II
VISALGADYAAFLRALAHGDCGVRRVDFESFAADARALAVAAAPVQLPAAAQPRRPAFELLDRVSQLALIAATEAVEHSGLLREPGLARDTGVFVGTAMGGATSMERAYADIFALCTEPRPFTVLSVMNNAAAGHISIRFGFKGPNVTLSSACASSALAIGEAFRAVRSGQMPCALAGGTEACLVPGVLRAWQALKVMAPPDGDDAARSCRPFSADRRGLVLGEGAAFVALEAAGTARRRGARILAEISGFGRCADGVHVTTPNVEGQVRAMHLALADAALEPRAIDYVNAHGTATPVGDVCEMLALKRTFGGHARELPVSSTKSAHGHLLGAAGAVEFAACLAALAGKFLPATLNRVIADPECDLDCVPNRPRHGVRLQRFMSNSFAFGGSNAVLIGGEYRD